MVSFSALIPTFNRSTLIQETLDSLLAQKRPFEQMIVVDDGSTDDTSQVIASRYPSCRYIKQPHGHVQRARNAGISAAGTDWVVLCDSDDLLTPDYLAELAGLIAANPRLDVVYANHTTFGDRRFLLEDRFASVPDFWADLEDTGTAFLGGGPAMAAKVVGTKGFLWPTGLAVRCGFFARVGMYDERMAGLPAEDLEFTLRAIAGGRAGFLKQPLARIREHAGNISHVDALIHLGGTIEVLQFALDHHPEARTDPLRQALLVTLSRHRQDYLYQGFRLRDWQAVRSVTAKLRGSSLSAKQRFKVAIARLPEVLGNGVHRLVLPILSQGDG